MSVTEHLETLGIRRLPEWDVLSYIYTHGASLASADRIALLLGYGKIAVGAALDALTAAGLLRRSRNSHGVRFYQMASHVPDEARRRALEELMKATEDRSGRLLIVRRFRQSVNGKEWRERGGLHLA